MLEMFPYKDNSTIAKLKIELKAYPELDYSLVLIQNFIWKDGRLKTEHREYVCAWSPSYKDGMIDHWGQGHYFTDIDNAISYMNSLKERF